MQDKTKEEKKLKQKSPQDIQMEKTMRFMRLLLPAMMIIFALTNSASFGIYLIASSLIGIITNFATSFLVNKMTRKEEEKYKAWLEKEAIHQAKKVQNSKPQMVNYKSISGKM
jgi:membrane protein insertase Oxa1/YidC/SpoIIIJ